MKLKKIVGAAILVIIAGGLVILGVKRVEDSKTATSTTKITVTASYYPLYDFAKNIGGDKVQAINVTPAGSEPHDFDPSPQQLVDAWKSQVFIYNGATLEPWVDKFLPDYENVVVKVSNGIDLMESEAEAGEENNVAVQDPHFWLDPTLAEKMVDNIKDGLIKADPDSSVYFTARAAEYKAKLAQLDQDYKDGLANCQTRTIVASHGAFSYLGKRYNLDVESISGLSPDQEPSAARLAELSQLVKEKNIKYVFFESLVSPKLAETVANEAGAKTIVFDPIEGIIEQEQEQGKDYLSVQRENLANLRTALACQ